MQVIYGTAYPKSIQQLTNTVYNYRAVFAGHRLHTEIEKQEDEEWEELFLESEELGLRGRLDALRTHDGQTIPYEHKRGRAHRDENKQPQAWESDRLQIFSG
jgi:CRISPR-associated protein Cas1